MGEEKFAQTALVKAVQGAIAVQPQQSGDLRVATPGGVFQVRWDESASASALGQLAFFGEYLEVSQLFERWVESCPLEYTSPNAPEVRDDFNRAEAERVAEQYEWRGLEIRSATETGDTAQVECVVRFRREQQESTTMGVFCFRRDHGEWFYVSTSKSQFAPQRVTKVGRNDPCPCNSGKKAKKCCGVSVGVK